MNTLFEIQQKMQPDDSNEWYTPSRYVDAARSVMGRIDLDPASCALANQLVRATTYYSLADNGLSLPWQGNVWLNPPYSPDRSKAAHKRSLIALWINKLIAEYQSGGVLQAVLLCTCYAEGSWFQPLWDYPICFANHKLHFYKPKGNQVKLDSQHGHVYGTVFVYLGTNEQAFINVFSPFGRVAKAVDSPLVLPKPLQLWDREGVS